MEDETARELADWLTEVSRKQGAIEIVLRRLVDEVEAQSPGAADRVFAAVRAPADADAEILGNLNAIIAELRGD